MSGVLRIARAVSRDASAVPDATVAPDNATFPPGDERARIACPPPPAIGTSFPKTTPACDASRNWRRYRSSWLNFFGTAASGIRNWPGDSCILR